MTATLQSLLAPLNQVTANADRFFARAGRLLGPALPCQAGCDACCYQDLTVVIAEAVSILVGLSRLPADRLAQLQSTALTYESCALLVDRHCDIYEHRPLVCRTHGLPLLQRGSAAEQPLLIDGCARSGVGELEAVPSEGILDAELLTAALAVADGLIRQALGVEQPVRIAISRIVNEGLMALPEPARERLAELTGRAPF